MQTGIHPTYHQKTAAKCVCGAKFDFGSTAEEISTELCSACHPFYTGKQNLVDTAGKVDKFRAKLKKAASAKTSQKKTKVSEAVIAAAGTKSTRRTSAVDGKKVVGKVKAGGAKELTEKDNKKSDKKGTTDNAKQDTKKPTEKIEEKAVEPAAKDEKQEENSEK